MAAARRAPPARRGTGVSLQSVEASDPSTVAERIAELRREHRALDERIQQLAANPEDDLESKRLKKRKLQLKDCIARLESLCQQAAQRLSLLYAPAAPEFFDKSLFRGFIQKLREMKLVWPDQNSKLLFDDRLDAWAKDAKLILGRELRHTIERVSPEAARPEAVEPAPAD